MPYPSQRPASPRPRSRATLSAAEAKKRLAEHAPIAGNTPRPTWLKFLDQFKNVLVIVLVGAVALAGAMGDLKEQISGGLGNAGLRESNMALGDYDNPFPLSQP